MPFITKLQPGEIFVFGSNTAGVHGSGAALQARMWFGAALGVGEGLTGQSYALPTLNADSCGGLNLRKRTGRELFESILKFYSCCIANPDLTFLLTKVGCGLAGYNEGYIKLLFHSVPGKPPNIVWPEGWKP